MILLVLSNLMLLQFKMGSVSSLSKIFKGWGASFAITGSHTVGNNQNRHSSSKPPGRSDTNKKAGWALYHWTNRVILYSGKAQSSHSCTEPSWCSYTDGTGSLPLKQCFLQVELTGTGTLPLNHQGALIQLGQFKIWVFVVCVWVISTVKMRRILPIHSKQRMLFSILAADYQYVSP